jgi:nucleoside-triphosphatase THEP1
LSLEPIELDEEWLEEKRVDGKVGSIVASVYGMIDTTEINDPCYLLSIIRPEIVEHLKKLGWKVEQVKMGDTIFLIKLQTSRKVGKIRKKVEKIELYFILTVSQKGSPIFFPINKENAEK